MRIGRPERLRVDGRPHSSATEVVIIQKEEVESTSLGHDAVAHVWTVFKTAGVSNKTNVLVLLASYVEQRDITDDNQSVI